jgi:hypothetical protein
MKKIYLLLLVSTVLFGNDTAHTFAQSEDCKACHTQIYDEFYGSVHANSTPQKDPIHNAVWANHPQNKKLQQYGCGKCHTPAADDLDKMITKGQKALPNPENATHQEGISCAYCHRIESIELHAKSNTNIISKEEKKYFGTLKEHVASPYHAIETEGNEHMRNGNVCIGCHSHKMNKWGLNVCSTNIDNEMDGANCVSCHMPKVEGSVSAFKDTKKTCFPRLCRRALPFGYAGEVYRYLHAAQYRQLHRQYRQPYVARAASSPAAPGSFESERFTRRQIDTVER